MTASFIEIGATKSTRHQKADVDIILYVLNGEIEIRLQDNSYIFGAGKTILIPKGSYYQLFGNSTMPKLIKVAKYSIKDIDISNISKNFIQD